MKKIPEESINMACLDIPYAHINAGKQKSCTSNAWDVPLPLGSLWDNLLAVGNKRCVYVFTATQPFASELVNFKRDLFKYDLIWIKTTPTGFLLSKHRPLRSHEHVLVFCKGKTVYNPVMTISPTLRSPKTSNRSSRNWSDIGRITTNIDDGRRFPQSHMVFKSVKKQMIQHPTQKPVSLLQYLIRTYTNKGDRIMDPTMGSASSGIAALSLGRNFVGIEKDASFFKIAVERMKKAMSEHHQAEMLL